MVSIRDIYDFYVCPYRIYLKRHLALKQPYLNLIFEEAKKIEEETKEILKKKFKNVKFNVKLECKKLNLIGILDGIITNGIYSIPIEIKFSSKIHEWYFKQIVAEGILIECSLNKIVKEGILYLTESKRFITINIKDYEKLEIIDVINKINKIYNGYIPKKKKGFWCKTCEFKYYCQQ